MKTGKTHDRIVREARAVFAENGFDAATFEEIAEKLELTRPAINYHFDSKQALYRTVLDDTYTNVIGNSARVAELQDTLTDQITTFIALLLASDPGHSAAAFMVSSVVEVRRHPDLVGTELNLVENTRTFVNRVIRKAIERDELDHDVDAKSLTDVMLAVLWGMVWYVAFIDGVESLPDVTQQFRKLLIGELWRKDPAKRGLSSVPPQDKDQQEDQQEA